MNPIESLRIVRQHQARMRRDAQVSALVRESRRQRSGGGRAATALRWEEHALARGSTPGAFER